MDYRADQVFQQAAAAAKLGWKIVKLWGVRDNCTCTCQRGSECSTPGKHPAGGNDWPVRATDDESAISEWFDYDDHDDSSRVNIGLLLGKVSGVIDVEVDTPEAEETLRRYGLDKIQTPTYKASRGCHRLFAFCEQLPDVAVVKVDHLEVRIGGGGKAAQSVMPCSWHRTGIQYQWLPGLSPEEVDPVPLPAEFIAAVRGNSKVSGSGTIAQAMAIVASGGQVSAGERHGSLLGHVSGAVKFWPAAEFTEERRMWLVGFARDFNAVHCVPKKDDYEVNRIANDQFAYYRRLRSTSDTDFDAEEVVRRPYEVCGLAWDEDSRVWGPGGWRLTVVHSHPIEYRLTLPFDGRTVSVSIPAEDWQRSHRVSALILAASARVDMDNPNAKKWNEVWCGYRIRTGDGGFRDVAGLKTKLLDEAVDEVPSVDALSWSQHAAFLLSYLRPFARRDEDDERLSADGTPKWVLLKGKWTLHIKWHILCGRAWEASKGGVPGEDAKKRLKAAILAATGEEDFTVRQVGVSTGERQRWIVWDDDHIRALETLTGA